jgi:hypothetical protein
MVIKQMSSVEEMRQTAIAVVDRAVEEGLRLFRGVVQRYMAYVQGVAPEILFPEGVQKTNEVGFLDKNKKQWFMKLDIVDDKFYKFPLEKCPGKVVRDMMEKVMRNLKLVYKMVLETEVDPARVPRPELFIDSQLVMTPLTSCFIYNPQHGRVLHDEFPRRIAFVWTAEAIEQAGVLPEVHPERPAPLPHQPNIAVPCPHPDDFLGPAGAKNMPEEDISALIAQINQGRCRVCGGPETDACGCLTTNCA